MPWTRVQPSGPALPATSSSPVDQPAATGADADTAEQSVTANGSQVAVVEVELAMAAAINALIATQAARKGAVHEQLKFVGEHILRAAADGSVPTAEGVPDGHTAETAAGLRNDVWASAPAADNSAIDPGQSMEAVRARDAANNGDGDASASNSSLVEEALKKLARAPLDRVAKRVSDAVNEELGALFEEAAAHFASALVDAMPAELRVAWVAEVCNKAYDALRAALTRCTVKNAKLGLAVGEEAMGELKLTSKIAAAAHAKVECSIKWQAPAATPEMKATAAKMALAQANAVQCLNRRDATGAEAHLDELFESVKREQMPLYKKRVEALHANDGKELYAILPGVVFDLLPKFERIYLATGDGLVRNEICYSEFNRLENDEFVALNRGPKPSQPVRTVREVLVLSVEAMPVFDALMTSVANEARRGDAALGISPGGVSWELGPLKKVQRVIEKLSLDPTQRTALDTLDADALDASGVLDTVRGMMTCNSMAHALLVLRCFAKRFGLSGSERVLAYGARSKNRFAAPSGGGWMDCLINVAVQLPSGRGYFMCEVQLVHAQLLTVRAELGAHHGYNDYRAALEMLEASGCLELGSGDKQAMKRWVVRNVFAALCGEEGVPLVDARTCDDKTLDAIVKRLRWCLSTVGAGRPWPRLLDLDLEGQKVERIVQEPPHAPVVMDALRGLRGVAHVGGAPATTVAALAEKRLGRPPLNLWSHVLEGHTGSVLSACVTPDGQHVVTASDDKTARVWLLAEG